MFIKYVHEDSFKRKIINMTYLVYMLKLRILDNARRKNEKKEV